MNQCKIGYCIMSEVKKKEEIEAMLEKAIAAVDNPKFHAQTYEEGVRAALEWVLGEISDDEAIL